MKIVRDDLSGKNIARFLAEHVEEMRSVSPPESKHALDLDGLRVAEITFWSLFKGDELIGCGALKELDPTHGEIKSMRVSRASRGGGVGEFMLRHMIAEAQHRNYQRLSLETGSMDFFRPARALYRKLGFTACPPFASYMEDPNSVFMTLDLPEG